ncbi:hypothetical protein D0X99_16945 [Algoriphagus lacus]|uniref:Uncharacterized protein n=1 Tax=Algoriphagus lacus TaxID=2056311 RepID=A0A418PMT3_9BACT|nr:hypothetical protein D0X99_16945 [Algoriphagus lacus]
MPTRWKPNRLLEFGELDCKSYKEGLTSQMSNNAATSRSLNPYVFLPFPSSLFGGQKVTKKPWATGFTSNRLDFPIHF